MHVLQTPVRYPPYIGGVESHVHDLSRNLVDLGHEVTVVCANEQTEGRKEECVDGVDVRRLPTVGKVAKTNITPSLPVELLRTARAADVIHTHLPTPWSADWSALAGAITDTPVVVTYHNDIVGDGFANHVARAYNASALRVTLRLADRVIATQPEYVDQSPVLDSVREKVEIIRNGVDTDVFRPVDVDTEHRRRLGLSADRDTIFFLSVLDEYHRYKGLDDLLRAVASIVDRQKPTPRMAADGGTMAGGEAPPRLVVGGDGELVNEYRELAAELGVEDHVRFLGRVSDDDLQRLYSAADLFALPSTSSDQEGFGLVVLEALACETPVVTTDVVGVADRIATDGLGAIVETNDPSSLARTIERSLSGADFEVGRGRQICREEFSWRSIAQETAELYAELQ